MSGKGQKPTKLLAAASPQPSYDTAAAAEDSRSSWNRKTCQLCKSEAQLWLRG